MNYSWTDGQMFQAILIAFVVGFFVGVLPFLLIPGVACGSGDPSETLPPHDDLKGKAK